MRTATERPRSVYIPGWRRLGLVAFIALPVLAAADLGSIALVKLSAEDDAGEAARAGVNAIQFDNSATPQAAETAFRAANGVAELNRMDIDQKTFIVYADGSVHFTAHRDAPTILFKRLPWFRDHTDTTVSATAGRTNW